MKEKVGVLGGGGWGTALAIYWQIKAMMLACG